jgi:hypothetical protein
LESIGNDDTSFLPNQQHALLLYSGDEDKASKKYVNEALRRGHLTIYSPVNNKSNSKIGSEIINYEDNVNRGNLLTLDIRSFYNLLLAGNTEPFEELKILLEEAIKERIASGKKNDEVTFVSGIAGTLAKNQEFDQCMNAEQWWQKTHSEWVQKGLKVTMVCLHPRTILDKDQFTHYKQEILSLHQIVT